ncbi:DEAD/DEAH box helicase [Pedobacter sp. P351]|uniref:DEAD/DEAH box helicase n=1 Tax=Pedobacter superstes TaxID=3133441 RepID=UPI0030B35A2C
MWLEKLKLNKSLVRSITDAGFITPKEVQVKTMTRIIGGQDIIAIGPEGCGKTSTYILGVLTKLKNGFEDAPRALILVPDKERVLSVIEQFELLNKNKTIRIVGLYAAPGIESQMNDLADGCDIVVATPDRARALYLKLGLNLNKIIMFVVDDAEVIVKQGLQLPVVELANSITKCQHLIFAEVMHERLNKMISPFIKEPFILEIEELGETAVQTHQQLLYHVPNFRTKVNLLSLLLNDSEVFTKTVVFVNTRLTAEKVYNHLKMTLKDEVAILNPIFFESHGVSSIDDFYDNETVRVLLVANELKLHLNLTGIPFMIQAELPHEKEEFISRILQNSSDDQTIAITFTTDLELPMVRKIEQSIGQRIQVAELPENLIIDVEPKDTESKKPKTTKVQSPVEEKGAAFHEKKASNSKDYNYSSGLKAKMNKKKNH